jgi:hypothetical protein
MDDRLLLLVLESLVGLMGLCPPLLKLKALLAILYFVPYMNQTHCWLFDGPAPLITCASSTFCMCP